jgi:Domain of unknown function (DUF4440)
MNDKTSEANPKLAAALSDHIVGFWNTMKDGKRKEAAELCATKSTFFNAAEGFDPNFAGNLHDCAMKIQKFSISPEGAAQLSPDSAILAYKQQFHGNYKGVDKTTGGTATAVFVREHGQWKIAHIHEACA